MVEDLNTYEVNSVIRDLSDDGLDFDAMTFDAEDIENKVQLSDEDKVSDSIKVSEKFKQYIGDSAYLILDKDDLLHFVRLIGYHARLGFDVYSTSFKLDTSDLKNGKVSLVYNNKLTLSTSSIKVVDSQGGFGSHIISVNTMLKLFSSSVGNVYMFIQEKNIYAYLFGGKVFVETFQVAEDICSKDFLIKQLGGKPLNTISLNKTFVPTLESVNGLIKLGSRVEERAIYFDNGSSYIYSGQVLGKFPGIGTDIVLQYSDMSSVMLFLSDIVDSEVELLEYDKFYCFKYGERSIYIAKKSMKLSDDMKFVDTATKNSTSISIGALKDIVTFLNNMDNNTGMLDLDPKPYGFDVVCFQKTMDNSSRFPLHCDVSGDGISKIRIPVNTLRLFTKIFVNDVVLKTEVNKLFIEGEEGRILIYGNV